MEYTFIPLPFYDEEDGQWKPSVKVMLGEQFSRWTVYDLGFDELRFTLPYAQEFARGEAALCEASLEHYKGALNGHPGRKP